MNPYDGCLVDSVGCGLDPSDSFNHSLHLVQFPLLVLYCFGLLFMYLLLSVEYDTSFITIEHLFSRIAV